MAVRTFYEPFPGPRRDFDWCAYDFDNYEPGEPVGYGRTEEEALADLEVEREFLADIREDRKRRQEARYA